MKFAVAILSLLVIFGLAFITSSDRKHIRYRPILGMLFLQIASAYLLLNTPAGGQVIGGFSATFSALLGCAQHGVYFVFGELIHVGGFNFFFQVLLPIVFISALIGILQYLYILPLIMKAMGFLLSSISRLGKLESYNGIASFILGQSEVFISMKRQLPHLSSERLYTLCATAMSTVSMSIVGSYMQIIDSRFVVAALALNLFGSFIIISIINPYQVSAEDDQLTVDTRNRQSLFEMLGEYILDGFKVAVIIAAMMIGYTALLALLNLMFKSACGYSFQELLGYLFAPLALLTGIPLAESTQAGSIMATKLVSNEFLAMQNLRQLSDVGALSTRTIGIVSVFLVSFANFSSIGVIVGAIKGLNEKQSIVAARFGMKLLYGATLVSLLSATVASLFL